MVQMMFTTKPVSHRRTSHREEKQFQHSHEMLAVGCRSHPGQSDHEGGDEDDDDDDVGCHSHPGQSDHEGDKDDKDDDE